MLEQGAEENPMPLPDMGVLNHQDNDRLHGWKDIAAFMGKSVRTVQRWEKEFGLPIHRIHGNGGEIVFGVKAEIDAWLLQDGQPLEHESNGNGHEPVPSQGELPQPGRIETRMKIWRATAVGTSLMLLVLAGWILGPRLGAMQVPIVDKQVAGWLVKSGSLVALNAAGRELWRDHGQVLEDESYQDPNNKKNWVQIADLDGDGKKEVLYVVDSEGSIGEVRALNSDGTLRFTHRVMETVRYGDETLGPPWYFGQVFVGRNADGSVALWSTIRHHLWHAAAVEKLDARGNVLERFWSAGHITFVQEATVDGRHVLLVGATNNESKGASVAVLDYEHPRGTAPAQTFAYACRDCPKGNPIAFVVFPQTEISRALNTRPNISFIRQDGAGNPLLDVLQADGRLPNAQRKLSTVAFYSLTPDFKVRAGETGDGYRMDHAALEMIGKLDHPFGLACEAELFPVQRWDGKRFVRESGQLASPPRGAVARTAGNSASLRPAIHPR